MKSEVRKELFGKIQPLITQGKNADQMEFTQIEKMVKYGEQITKDYEQTKDYVTVIKLVNSILACFDGEQER